MRKSPILYVLICLRSAIKLESLGRPKILIVPNRIHRLDAGVYKKCYPQLVIVCPAVAEPYVEKRIFHLNFSELLPELF